MNRRPTTTRLLSYALSAAILAPTLAESASVAAFTPPLMLAQIYEPDSIDLDEYWISEKYDGVRAYWNGTLLTTRAGHPIAAPGWFTRNWPTTALDGELWIGRGRFEELLATVRDSIPDDAAWGHVRYIAFDLPAHPGPFDERRRALSQVIASHDDTTIHPIKHWRVASEHSLQAALDAVVAAGGEGLILRRQSGLYSIGRSNDILKMKPYLDAEAEVIGYVPGSGRLTNMLGALEVRTPQGMTFRIGTGFTDAQRAHPPAIGTRITYRYHGVTASGVPRFASFLRERNEDGQTRSKDKGEYEQ